MNYASKNYLEVFVERMLALSVGFNPLEQREIGLEAIPGSHVFDSVHDFVQRRSRLLLERGRSSRCQMAGIMRSLSRCDCLVQRKLGDETLFERQLTCGKSLSIEFKSLLLIKHS